MQCILGKPRLAWRVRWLLHDISIPPGVSPVLPPWESRQLVKRTAHFDAHLRVSSTPRCGSATASGTGAYSDFLADDGMPAQEQRARLRAWRAAKALRVQPGVPRGD